jgi:DNA replication protein DnaC
VKAIGDILDAALAAAAAASCSDDHGEELRRRQTDARVVRDRLPEFVRGATAEQMRQRIPEARMLETARAWRWGMGNVLLAGPTDSGKTTAAAYLFKRLLAQAVQTGEEWERARWMRWVSAEDLSVARRGQALGRGEPPEAIEAINARLLFLDDIGWDKDITEVCSVLAARYDRGVPTVFTTGLPRGDLLKHYGAAVVRRMLEAGGRKPVIVECFPKG